MSTSIEEYYASVNRLPLTSERFCPRCKTQHETVITIKVANGRCKFTVDAGCTDGTSFTEPITEIQKLINAEFRLRSVLDYYSDGSQSIDPVLEIREDLSWFIRDYLSSPGRKS